ncbi:MAG: diaminobutyrate--2-oxoglutarate transaminase [Gammaproteobacteria bacterium]|nr:diaminobutyrate--2-oxoglutarate transaminase [Gammaproteobacteria bacterium]
MNQIIDQYESEVRGYCRTFNTTFEKAQGSWLIDTDGKRYLDFLAGAGVLNYGHNPPELKRRLLEYIEQDGITHSLDMYSSAKARFLQRFNEVILEPRGMEYKVQFPGPTGTNAVEAAMKLARKVTGRTNIVYFTNAFHGMTAGSLAVTGNAGKRSGAGQPLGNTTPMPFDGYLGHNVDSLEYLDRALEDAGSGLDKPAAVIVETVQAEGGVNVASGEWLQRLASLCRRHDVLLIVDDIQIGCGRSGGFFSFEEAGIRPDLVTLSKSLSGYGLPLAVVLIRPELDIWSPGEHNGTFRGNNTAFVTAEAALDFWENDAITPQVERKGPIVRRRLERIAAELPSLEASVRGRGFIWGLDCGVSSAAGMISEACFERGLIMETAGIDDQVLKFLAPLTINDDELEHGLDIVADAAADVAGRLNNKQNAA